MRQTLARQDNQDRTDLGVKSVGDLLNDCSSFGVLSEAITLPQLTCILSTPQNVGWLGLVYGLNREVGTAVL
nr:hypothetical protein CFP56_32188 [Quercus suber]